MEKLYTTADMMDEAELEQFFNPANLWKMIVKSGQPIISADHRNIQNCALYYTLILHSGRRLVPHSMRFTYITRMSLYVDAHDLYKMTGHDSREMIDYYNRKNLEMALSRIPKADDGTRALLPAKISNV